MNDRIRELNRQIAAERRNILDCKHDYGKPYSNPETSTEPYGSRMVAQGSDIWYEPEGYHEVTKPRWTKKCTRCGDEQHTYKQKPIIKGYEPDF